MLTILRSRHRCFQRPATGFSLFDRVGTSFTAFFLVDSGSADKLMTSIGPTVKGNMAISPGSARVIAPAIKWDSLRLRRCRPEASLTGSDWLVALTGPTNQSLLPARPNIPPISTCHRDGHRNRFPVPFTDVSFFKNFSIINDMLEI